ncbi:hypothetical protein B0181_10290 [Moraxella caviae]|uniref:Abi-like protein n=1 Tax=Moraxella caviae TaxID=34060 RepID=A0A1S9ZVP4_9GAMM|nr:Abi family protein [Moraxella caviae]OOR87483.1 hypothetical protein B0181_10290 [Moraxella caviae]STZ10617.1 Abi-like protein [Moraxella caviae]
MSVERSQPYIKNTQTLKSALELYKKNSELCALCWTPIQHCEVVLRNMIDKALVVAYGENWLVQTVFLNTLKEYKRHKIDTSIKKFMRKNKSLEFNRNQVVADLELSFWQEITSKKYLNRVWVKAIDAVFPNRPKNLSVEVFIKELYANIEIVRRLRNRIAHHEPIYYKNINKAIKAIVFILQAASSEFLELTNPCFQPIQDKMSDINHLL